MSDIITFNPNGHKYINQNGLEYISVTTLLGNEFPFNAREIANKVRTISGSKYNGMSVNKILDMWDASSVHGNVVHDMIEQYIKYNIVPSDPLLVPLFNKFCKLRFTGKLLSETLIWDEEYHIAGLCDIIEVFHNKIFLYDIKTSANISDNKFAKYSMQLELYRRMIEKQFNKPTTSIAIIWFADYVNKRDKAKMKLFQPLQLNNIVDELLEKRKKEIICQ